MKIWKNLRPENIFLNAPLPDKETVLRFISEACVQNRIVNDGNTLYEGMRDREQTMSTGIGGGLAFPHTTNLEAASPTILLIRPSKPVDFDALDKKPVDIILALIIPENQRSVHLQILAGVSRICKNRNVLKAVKQASNSDDLWDEIRNLEEKMAFH